MSYIYALTDTWNSAPTTFVGIGLNVTDTASAAGSLLMDLQVGGSSLFSISKAGIAKFADRASGRDMRIEPSTTGAAHRFFSNNTAAGYSFENNSAVLATLSVTTGLGIGSGADLFLARDAANTLAQRNGTNAQTFRLYNTYTDASNYERLTAGWSGNIFYFGTQAAGTGTGSRDIFFFTNGTNRWSISGSGGHFLAAADNTYDIGASGANRPRHLYVAGNGVFGGYVYAAPDSGLGLNGRAYLVSGTAGVIRLSDWTGTSFDRLQFGGTTSAFPALKRSGAELQARLADDSALTGLQASTVIASTYLAITNGNTSIRQVPLNDALLFQNNSNFMEQRNGVNAQTFRIYNTYTDASNYERGELRWNANSLELIAAQAGTGATRSLRFGINNSAQWAINTSGHFVTVADNTYDIGASGANRPRDLWVARNADVRGSFFIGGFGELIGISAGVVLLRQFGVSDFSRLQFGGTTNAYPSLKRDGTVLQVRLADDSSSADFTAAQITANASTAMPAGGAVTAGVKMSTTANFGVFFGSGAPTLSAAKGSLYLRSDGTTTNDRMYVNTDGATTWTAVTTAA